MSIWTVDSGAPKPADLAGRYVFSRGGRPWRPFIWPRLVVRTSSAKLYLDREEGYDDNSPQPLRGGPWIPAGFMLAASAACICDTLEEANHVLALMRSAELRYAEFVQSIAAEFRALNGEQR